MAHGQSSDPIRRAGWLAVACGLAACGLTTGCHGPEKDDGMKSLDPATKQKLLGIAPLPGKPGTGNASTDQRFNRTTPVKLPAPELAPTNPPVAAQLPAQPATGTGPLPPSMGSVVAPTRPTGNPAVLAPQPADGVWPQPPADPITRTGGTVPPAAEPLRDLSPPGGRPAPAGAEFPPAVGPAMPSGVLPVAPLSNPIPQDLPPAGLPTAGLPTVGGPPAPPVPGQSTLPLPAVPSITDLPPLVK